MTHPLSVQIITRDRNLQKEIHQEYVVRTRHPRWELTKILVRALFNLKYR